MRKPNADTTATILRRFHLAGIIIWALLAIPTVLWWRNSILWVSLMSVYAIVLAHWASYQASRTEKREMERQQ